VTDSPFRSLFRRSSLNVSTGSLRTASSDLGRRRCDTALGSSFAKNSLNASTNGRTAKRGTTSKSAWIANVYLDLDVILAELKTDDWLASDVDIESIEDPKTSIATGIELQYVMEDEWERDRVVRAHQEIVRKNIELVPLTSEALDAAADLRAQYGALNTFDGVHLGSAAVLDEPIVSTDTLFPEIPEIEHIDPRDLE
jgi:hypothetical protein